LAASLARTVHQLEHCCCPFILQALQRLQAQGGTQLSGLLKVILGVGCAHSFAKAAAS
jgi:hypothetical protein